MKLSTDLNENIEMLKQEMPIGKSFDLITRQLVVGERNAFFLGVNGLCKTELLQWIIAELQNPALTGDTMESIRDYMNRHIAYVQTMLCQDSDVIMKNVVSGPVALLVDGFSAAIVIDVRTYPTRGMEEPDIEMVTKGSRDGFVETMLINANLIRRRVRDPRLTFELKSVGKESKTDVSLVYVGGLAEDSLVEYTKEKLESLNVSSLTMGSKSLEELLVKKSWLHPLPVIKTTERPDTACSYLMEGYVLLLVDNSPSVLILPCSIFQFTQSTEDYYKSPAVGNYFRMIRFFCLFASLLLLPLFFLITAYYPEFATSIRLIQSEEFSKLELFIFVLVMELGLDVFRYSSMHSPSRYSGPLSIIGGLIAGDVAIELSWVSKEVLFYAAVTLLTTLALSDISFGEGIRLYRMFLLLFTGLFGPVGFAVGLGLVLLSVVTTPTYGGRSYFWPLMPFHWKALKAILFRYPTYKAQPESVWRREK